MRGTAIAGATNMPYKSSSLGKISYAGEMWCQVCVPVPTTAYPVGPIDITSNSLYNPTESLCKMAGVFPKESIGRADIVDITKSLFGLGLLFFADLMDYQHCK